MVGIGLFFDAKNSLKLTSNEFGMVFLRMGVAETLSKFPIPTHPDHQSLRRPSSRHIKQPRRFLLILSRRRHMPHPGQRHYRKLQPLADLHGHDLDSVGAGVEVSRPLAQVEGQPALLQRPGAQVHGGVVGAQDRHVAPGVAFFVGVAQFVGNGKGFVAQCGQAKDQRRLALASAADGLKQRNAVVVFVVRSEQVGRHQAGGLQYLFGVAVVDLQDGGAALRLHAHTLEAELFAARAFVNALRVVVKQQQAVGGGVHHLGD